MNGDMAWRRIAAEGVVVIASILIAFGVDAWWAERSERAAEMLELSRVATELRSEVAEISRSIGRHERASAASVAFLRLVDDVNGESELVLVPDTILAGLLFAPSFETAGAALDGLLGSGRISIVSDAEIRERIIDRESRMQDVMMRQDRDLEFIDLQLLPALLASGDLAHIPRWRGPLREEFDREGMTLVRADAFLMGLVAHRAALSSDVQVMLRRARVSNERGIETVERALNR